MEKRFLSMACADIALRYAEGMAADLPDDVTVDPSAAVAVVGYAAKFNSRSELMIDDKGRKFVEVIDPGAFDAVLGDDVVALFNHDPSMVLARSSAGSLRLSVDAVGLRYEFDIADDDCSELVAAYINDGRVRQSSFAFIVAPDGDSFEKLADGIILRRVQRIARLLDVSPVTYPAYSDATVALRAQAFEAAEQAESAAEAARIKTASAHRAREIELQRLR